MTCSELEQFLYPYLDGEFEADETMNLERHLASCSACATKVHAEKQFLAALRVSTQGLSTQPPAPEALRARLKGGFDETHRRDNLRRMVRVSAAAAVLVMVGTTAYLVIRPMQRQRYVEDAALRHARRYPLEIKPASQQQPGQLPSQLPSQLIEAWFGGKLDHKVALPRFANATPAGARLLNVQEKQAAYISYDTAGEGSTAAPGRIGLFVYDDKAGDADFPEGANPQVGTSHGYNVVSWREGDVVYQLVTDLDEKDIRRMLTGDGLPRRTPGQQLPVVPVAPASLQQ
jgi:anti-sigma factor (TIGR02949 family)